MIFIDCREGVSSDMLLAAMLALVEQRPRAELIGRLVDAASANALQMRILEVEDSGDKGLGISYAPREHVHGTPYAEAVATLAAMNESLGSDSPVPRRILDEIAKAETAVHGVHHEGLHLHDVARPEALFNLAGIGLLHSELVSSAVDEFVCSTITTGKGIVVIGHGAVRLPAPATRHMLEGMKHEEGADPGERATPTGIAAVKAIALMQSDEAPRTHRRAGTGFGTRRFGGRLGRVRLLQT